MKGYTITDIGKVRSENQDCVRFIQNLLPRYGILALCDGMGGAKAGSTASDIALTEFANKMSENLSDKKSKKTLAEHVQSAAFAANAQVYKTACSDPAYEGMGTTLVAAVVRGRQCCIVNIGDSRAYLVAADTITQISCDHSFVAEMVSRGSITKEDARTHPRRNVITRALGVDAEVACDVFTPAFVKGNVLLLCSDGLSNTLKDEEILEIVQNSKNLGDAGRDLLDMALSRGAPDNVTVGLLQK